MLIKPRIEIGCATGIMWRIGTFKDIDRIHFSRTLFYQYTNLVDGVRRSSRGSWFYEWAGLEGKCSPLPINWLWRAKVEPAGIEPASRYAFQIAIYMLSPDDYRIPEARTTQKYPGWYLNDPPERYQFPKGEPRFEALGPFEAVQSNGGLKLFNNPY